MDVLKKKTKKKMGLRLEERGEGLKKNPREATCTMFCDTYHQNFAPPPKACVVEQKGSGLRDYSVHCWPAKLPTPKNLETRLSGVCGSNRIARKPHPLQED